MVTHENWHKTVICQCFLKEDQFITRALRTLKKATGASFISCFKPAKIFPGIRSSLKWSKTCAVQNALKDGWIQGIHCPVFGEFMLWPGSIPVEIRCTCIVCTFSLPAVVPSLGLPTQSKTNSMWWQALFWACTSSTQVFSYMLLQRH